MEVIERLFVHMLVSFVSGQSQRWTYNTFFAFLEAVEVVVDVSGPDILFELTVASTAEPQAPGTRFQWTYVFLSFFPHRLSNK